MGGELAVHQRENVHVDIVEPRLTPRLFVRLVLDTRAVGKRGLLETVDRSRIEGIGRLGSGLGGNGFKPADDLRHGLDAVGTGADHLAQQNL